MVIKSKVEKADNKKLRRNRDYGLLPKCYKYGLLEGVELFLGIRYIQKQELYTYSSHKGLSWLSTIADDMKQPNATNLLPHNVENKVHGKGYQLKEEKAHLLGLEASEDECLRIPDLPTLELSLLLGRSDDEKDSGLPLREYKQVEEEGKYLPFFR